VDQLHRFCLISSGKNYHISPLLVCFREKPGAGLLGSSDRGVNDCSVALADVMVMVVEEVVAGATASFVGPRSFLSSSTDE
jgi:hypothetical protein